MLKDLLPLFLVFWKSKRESRAALFSIFIVPATIICMWYGQHLTFPGGSDISELSLFRYDNPIIEDVHDQQTSGTVIIIQPDERTINIIFDRALSNLYSSANASPSESISDKILIDENKISVVTPISGINVPFCMIAPDVSIQGAYINGKELSSDDLLPLSWLANRYLSLVYASLALLAGHALAMYISDFHSTTQNAGA